jgi:hypothetical protein
VLLLLFACAGPKDTPSDTADADTDVDADTDADTDVDLTCEDGVHYFPEGAIWASCVAGDTPDPTSEEVISWLDGQGWGLGRFQIDFSLEVLDSYQEEDLRSFVPTGDFYSPDCDAVDVPVPLGGVLEGESGYACESDGDCHLIVRYAPTNDLYEMWRADIRDANFRGGCLAVWDLDRVYGPEGRGDQCTSADAAGYPIAPLLFTADEVDAGEIAHAIRFILPNTSIRAGEFVHPATHATGAASGPAEAPPYGARLRLKPDFDLDALPSDGARVVAVALQKYGMFLADGGNVALTAQSDRFTAAKWDGLLDPHDLELIQPSDFELLPTGDAIPLTYDCVRE